MMTWIRWTSLVLIGGCCHFGGHDAGDDEIDAPPTGCTDVEPSHEGHDESQEEAAPCDAGTEP